jgi:hypothetical protein
VLRHFSQRREEIEERAAELAGATAGALSRERMQGIALATRQPKDDSHRGTDWRAAARARAAEDGLGAADRTALITQAPQAESLPERDPEQLHLRLSGPTGLTESHNTFVRRHALAEIAGTFSAGASMHHSSLRSRTGTGGSIAAVASVLMMAVPRAKNSITSLPHP